MGAKKVNITPSPTGYRRLLEHLIEHSSNKSDREWAKRELKRVKNVKRWGVQEKTKKVKGR